MASIRNIWGAAVMACALCFSGGALANPDNPFLDESEIEVLAIEIEHCLRGDNRDECEGIFAYGCLEVPAGQTTAGMVQCQLNERDAWDILLNHYYQFTHATLSDWKNDGQMFAPDGAPADIYRDASRAWIAFRDAEIQKERLIWYGGSGSQVFAAGRALELTVERTRELLQFCTDVTHAPMNENPECWRYAVE